MGARPHKMGARPHSERAPKIIGERPHLVGGLVISPLSSLQLRVMILRSARGDTHSVMSKDFHKPGPSPFFFNP
jgi:hypothetical protein